MKTIGLLVLVTFLVGLTSFQADKKKEKRAQERLEMAQLIQSGRFRFVARSANTDMGTFNNLTPNYDMVFDSLQIKAFLPYYGRAYSVPYGGSEGVKFDLTAEKIERNWSERKKMFTISADLNNLEDSYSIYLTAGLDGYADLKINFRNRHWISYFGVIEKLEAKNK